MKKIVDTEDDRIPDCDDWTIEVFDVEAAFLNAEPGHKQHIYVPDAMIKTGMISQEDADECVFELTKSMYGNIDAALRFFEKYKKIMLSLGFIQCVTDPCVFYRLDKNDRADFLACSTFMARTSR